MNKYIINISMVFLMSVSFVQGSDESKMTIEPEWLGGAKVTLDPRAVDDAMPDWSTPTPVSIFSSKNRKSTSQLGFITMKDPKDIFFCISIVEGTEFKEKLYEILSPDIVPYPLDIGMPSKSENYFLTDKVTSIVVAGVLGIHGTAIESNDDMFFTSPTIDFKDVVCSPFTFIEFKAPEDCIAPKGLKSIRFYPASSEYVCTFKDLQIDFRPDHFNLSFEGVNFGLIKLFFSPDS